MYHRILTFSIVSILIEWMPHSAFTVSLKEIQGEEAKKGNDEERK